jgi:hypothetical protein
MDTVVLTGEFRFFKPRHEGGKVNVSSQDVEKVESME